MRDWLTTKLAAVTDEERNLTQQLEATRDGIARAQARLLILQGARLALKEALEESDGRETGLHQGAPTGAARAGKAAGEEERSEEDYPEDAISFQGDGDTSP